MMMGFLKDEPAEEKTISWSSGAFGKQEYLALDAEGTVLLDLLVIARRDVKLNNYKLKTFCNLTRSC